MVNENIEKIRKLIDTVEDAASDGTLELDVSVVTADLAAASSALDAIEGEMAAHEQVAVDNLADWKDLTDLLGAKDAEIERRKEAVQAFRANLAWGGANWLATPKNVDDLDAALSAPAEPEVKEQKDAE